MTIIECGICGSKIEEINDESNEIKLSYDGCEEDYYDEEKR